MMSLHRTSAAQYSENKAGGFPSGINTSNESLSPYYDFAQLVFSHSANKEMVQRSKEQLVCAVHQVSFVDVRGKSSKVDRNRLRRKAPEKREGDERQGEGLLINIP